MGYLLEVFYFLWFLMLGVVYAWRQEKTSEEPNLAACFSRLPCTIPFAAWNRSVAFRFGTNQDGGIEALIVLFSPPSSQGSGIASVTFFSAIHRSVFSSVSLQRILLFPL